VGWTGLINSLKNYKVKIMAKNKHLQAPLSLLMPDAIQRAFYTFVNS
jgi:hypothetical protein